MNKILLLYDFRASHICHLLPRLSPPATSSGNLNEHDSWTRLFVIVTVSMTITTDSHVVLVMEPAGLDAAAAGPPVFGEAGTFCAERY